MQEREQRQRRVPQPAVAVIPVPDAADPFRQRRRRRGDDPSRRLVDECLQHDERPDDDRAPVVGYLRLAGTDPLAPEVVRLHERVLGIDHRRQVSVRGEPGEGERHSFALLHRERRDRAEVLAARPRVGTETEAVGACDRDSRMVDAPHPRDDVPEVEADDELRPHLHRAANALDDAHDVRCLVARRHEVVDPHGPVVVLPRRLEDERLVAVSA